MKRPREVDAATISGPCLRCGLQTCRRFEVNGKRILACSESHAGYNGGRVFVLEIELGPGCETPLEMADMLHRSTLAISNPAAFETGEASELRDWSNRMVGHWHIEEAPNAELIEGKKGASK